MAALRKRLFICCDGTGRDSLREKNDYVTNVARFARCLKRTGKDGVLQLVYYHEGVAMHNGQFQYREAATGQGVHAMIQDAYYFLCLNLDFEESHHDEIHLVGFSRGAFAMRALACFIETVGILSKTRLALLPMVYSLWRNQDLERLEGHIKTWQAKGHLKRNVEIMSCGVWDTVSAIYPAKDLAFVAERVPKSLKNAFQALSLHEMRTSFPPILWNTERDASRQTNIKQCGLAGDHSDIGGGHPDSGLATVSLLWMVAQFREYTDAVFEEVMLLDCMTPLYLHWQEEAFFHLDESSFFHKQEYVLRSHIYTRGNVHGSESWSTALWYLPGQSSATMREEFLVSRILDEIVPPPPTHRAKPPRKDIDISVLTDDAVSTSQTLPDEGYTSDTTAVDTNNPKSPMPQIPPLSTPWPHIHFTVRILMSQRKQPCLVLERFSNIRHDSNIAWTDVTGSRGFFEEPPTAWESWMFRQWIKREEDMFSNELHSDDERFTRFLYPFRREGERPRKAFYSPTPRAASTDRSRKIKDANDRVAEASEKGPDLSQSRSSAATSIGSGVVYYLDLDYEGHFPERYGRLGNSGISWREHPVRGRYPALRPNLPLPKENNLSSSAYEDRKTAEAFEYGNIASRGSRGFEFSGPCASRSG